MPNVRRVPKDILADQGDGNHEPEPRASIQVVERLAQILSLFTPSRRELRVVDVAEELGLQRSTAHRYLTSLASVGLLERHEDEAVYTLGPLLIQIGTIALGGLKVVDVAVPYMQRLAEEAHQTVVLSLWGGHGPVVVRVQEDVTRLVQIAVRVGSALPLDSAQAQVFLTYLQDQSLAARLLANVPERQRQELERQMETVRRYGVAVNSRVIEGIRAIAAPVFDEHGDIAATLALVGTVAAIPAAPDSGLAAALKEVALELSLGLGYVPTPAY